MHAEFETYTLNPQGVKKARHIAVSFDILLTDLEDCLKAGTKTREFSLVKTKLEEASFFAKKALAIQLENQL